MSDVSYKYRETLNEKRSQKVVEKYVSILKQKMKNEKVCEIPNYAQIIRYHKRNHLEYYIHLRSTWGTEND